jgi:hypothetical protein
LNRPIQLLRVQDGQVVDAILTEVTQKHLNDAETRNLLREYLGHVLMERDFDSILTQVSRFIESLVVQAHTPSERAKLSSTPSEHVAEHIPTAELRKIFQSELGMLHD